MVRKTNYHEMLKNASRAYGSIACMGMDPDLQRIPLIKGSIRERLKKFYIDILDAAVSADVIPEAIKPNYGWWKQYGDEGELALKDVMNYARELKVDAQIPIIGDYKTGDIREGSAAYARIAFEVLGFDATTVHPYMGNDSVGPYVKWAEELGKGVHILARTSNEGAKDLQDLKVEVGGMKIPLFEVTTKDILGWGKNARGNVGIVAAATPQELDRIATIVVEKNFSTPILIPGVGAQGGSARTMTEILFLKGMDMEVQRINSTREINYAFEKYATDDFAGAAVKEIKLLKEEIALGGFKVK